MSLEQVHVRGSLRLPSCPVLTACPPPTAARLTGDRFAFEGRTGEEAGHFYTCTRTAELNAHFGDLLHKIGDMEAGQPSHSPPPAPSAIPVPSSAPAPSSVLGCACTHNTDVQPSDQPTVEALRI